MQRLEVELGVSFFSNEADVRSQRRFGNRFGVIVIVLLTFDERLHVDRRNDARLMAEPAQAAADER